MKPTGRNDTEIYQGEAPGTFSKKKGGQTQKEFREGLNAYLQKKKLALLPWVKQLEIKRKKGCVFKELPPLPELTKRELENN